MRERESGSREGEGGKIVERERERERVGERGRGGRKREARRA